MSLPQDGMSQRMAFPVPGSPCAEFDKCAADTPEITPASKHQKWETWLRQRYDHHLIYWRQLAPLYAMALQDGAAAEDRFVIQAECLDWPDSFDAQQQALLRLLDTSRLRQAWRTYCDWQHTHPDWHTPAQQTQREALDARCHAGNLPLREIPLYRGYIRCSCQQIVCLPEPQWQALFAPEDRYDPGNIDGEIVDCLAHRIARVFNEPAPEPGAAFHGWHEVWPASARGLTVSRDAHGISDRLFDQYLRPIEHPADCMPTWRFDGYYGLLKVTGVGEEPWYLAVLAPGHFLEHLMHSIRQADPAKASQGE